MWQIKGCSFATRWIGWVSYGHDQRDCRIGFGEKNPSKNISSYATLETYKETPICISVNITEESIESVAQTFLGSSGQGGTESEALQGWLLKFSEDSTRIRTSVETFVEWFSNGIPPWAAYREFVYGSLITLDKNPGVRRVGIG